MLPFALLAVSCQNDDFMEASNEAAEGVMTLHATMAPQTRAQIALGTEDESREIFMWNEEDSFTLYDKTNPTTTSAAFTISGYSEEAPATEATFVGEGNFADGSSVVAIYPAQEGNITESAATLTLPTATITTGSAEEWKEYMRQSMYMYADADVLREDGSSWRDYAKAAEAFKQVIDESGVGSTLPGTVDEIFGNTKDLENPTIPAYGDGAEGTANVEREWVYAFRFGHANGDENSIQWAMGSRAVSIMSTTGEAMCFWAGFDGMLPSDYCWKFKEDGGVWEKGDARRFVAFRGINENDSEMNPAEFNDPRNAPAFFPVAYLVRRCEEVAIAAGKTGDALGEWITQCFVDCGVEYEQLVHVTRDVAETGVQSRWIVNAIWVFAK